MEVRSAHPLPGMEAEGNEMKMKLTTRDKAGTWHGAPLYTLNFSMEAHDAETRNRIWEAIERALPEPETKSEKASAIGFGV